MRKLIWIKGNTGSGKSTIPISMLNLECSRHYVEYDQYCTVFHRCTTVAAGKYIPGKLTANGCDQLKTVDNVKAAVEHAIQTYPTYDVIFEGMMISTIKTTFHDFLLEMAEKYDIEPIIVVMKTTTKGCLGRISTRGTSKKPPKMENMERKNKKILSDAAWYEEQDLLRVEYLDVENTPESMMLWTFCGLVDIGYPMYNVPKFVSYKELVKASDEQVLEYMRTRHSGDMLATSGMDKGQLRRFVGEQVIRPEASNRKYIPTLLPYAPWEVVYYAEDLAVDVGYRSSSGNEMSLLVTAIGVDRINVPLLTEHEQVALCKDCKGSRGTCPGYAPRFDTMHPSTKNMWVIMVTMDYAWALEYSSLASWYMCSSYIDTITESYMNRLIKGLQVKKIRYIIGAHNCPAKCRPCAVINGEPCNFPLKRIYSMEATGVDCDRLHCMFYGEYLPWAYKGLDAVPLYMTRYAGVLTDNDIRRELRRIIVKDKTYVKEAPAIPDYPYRIYIIPSGIHKGERRYMYDLEEIRE